MLLLVLLSVGGILRLLDLTDPPLDFQPSRQLRNLLVARSIYYHLQPSASAEERSLADSFRRSVGLYEPPVIESLSAVGYLLAGETIAVPRVLQALFWLIAGLALFDMLRRIITAEAALLALAYYLLLPFSVQASRSFQPDPLMTSAFLAGLYFLYRWTERSEWKMAVLAGGLLGLAALVKIVVAFMAAGAAIALVVALGVDQAWRSRQVWAMAFLMIAPAFGYYIVGSPGRSTEYFFAWTVTLIDLVLTPEFYSRWLVFLGSLFGLTLLLLGLLGSLLAPARLRAILVGSWIGYVLYGLTLPFQMYTHSYYHLQLIPVVALGLAPIAALVLEGAQRAPRFWRAAALSLLFAAGAYQAWVARSVLAGEDFRSEPQLWKTVGQVIPANAPTIALTQDYGYRLMFWGWRKVSLWPITTELSVARGGNPNAADDFRTLTAGMHYFLVTAFGQLEKQPGLEQILAELPVEAEGTGYVLYRLPR